MLPGRRCCFQRLRAQLCCLVVVTLRGETQRFQQPRHPLRPARRKAARGASGSKTLRARRFAFSALPIDLNVSTRCSHRDRLPFSVASARDPIARARQELEEKDCAPWRRPDGRARAAAAHPEPATGSRRARSLRGMITVFMKVDGAQTVGGHTTRHPRATARGHGGRQAAFFAMLYLRRSLRLSSALVILRLVAHFELSEIERDVLGLLILALLPPPDTEVTMMSFSLIVR